MDAGSLMLALLNGELRVVQGLVLLLSTLGAMLYRMVESMLPTGSEFGGNKLVLLPVRTSGACKKGLWRPRNGEEGFPTREPARTILPSTRSSLKSRFSV